MKILLGSFSVKVGICAFTVILETVSGLFPVATEHILRLVTADVD
jgi:hypothetical protein